MTAASRDQFEVSLRNLAVEVRAVLYMTEFREAIGTSNWNDIKGALDPALDLLEIPKRVDLPHAPGHCACCDLLEAATAAEREGEGE